MADETQDDTGNDAPPDPEAADTGEDAPIAELPFDPLERTADEAVSRVKALRDPSDEELVALFDREASNSDYDDGRKTVLEAIAERMKEPAEGEDPAEAEEEDDAPAPGEPGSRVLVRIGAQEHEATVIGEVDAVEVELRDANRTREIVTTDDIRPTV